MDTETIQQWAREAGMDFHVLQDSYCEAVGLPIGTVCKLSDVGIESIEAFAHLARADLEAEVESLRVQVRKEQMYVQELAADAELWRAYKARKDAVIAAGMGLNPLRNEVKPDTYAVINKDGEVEYSAPWEEACHDHIKDMQDVHPAGTVSKWKVRGIKILPAIGATK